MGVLGDLRSLGGRSQVPFDARVRPTAAGLAADRPSASLVRNDRYGGTFYYETDTGNLWYSDGSSWAPVGTHRVENITQTGSATYFDFASIPSTYAHLRIVMQARGTDADTDSGVNLQFNGDTGASQYVWQQLAASGATVSAAEDLADPSMRVGRIPAANAPSGEAGVVVIDIPNYAGTTFRKQVRAQEYLRYNTSNQSVHGHGGTWLSTAAINRVLLSLSAGDFAAGSRATLYGAP